MDLEHGTIERWVTSKVIVLGKVCELRSPRYVDRGGSLLSGARKARGYSLRQASEICGVSMVEFSHLESGRLVSPELRELVERLENATEPVRVSEDD